MQADGAGCTKLSMDRNYGIVRSDGPNVWVAPLPIQSSRAVLYVHGWQPGHSTQQLEEPALPKETFVTPAERYSAEIDTSLPWRDAGYDVLVFSWAQYADEPTPLEAERKIWDNTTQHRWKDSNGASTSGSPPGSLGQALFEQARPLLDRYEHLHVVGHSLGCQMVTCLVQCLLEAHAKLPGRLTLLDPYFSNFGKCFLQGQWPGERVRDVVSRAAAAGVAIEQFKSSLVLNNPLSDTNLALTQTTAYVVMRPEFFKIERGPGDIQVLANRHAHAKYCYFASKGCPAPSETVWNSTDKAWCLGDSSAGHASVTDERVREMMAADWHWVQVTGTDSADPATHGYARCECTDDKHQDILCRRQNCASRQALVEGNLQIGSCFPQPVAAK